MFKIGSQRLAWIPVTWAGLAEDGSQVQNEIKLQVHLVDRSEFKAHLDAEVEGKALDDFATQNTKGWQGVGDASGNALPFSEAHFRQLLESPGFATAWGRAYMKAWTGQGEIRAGNSEASPADGGTAAGQSPAPAA